MSSDAGGRALPDVERSLKLVPAAGAVYLLALVAFRLRNMRTSAADEIERSRLACYGRSSHTHRGMPTDVAVEAFGGATAEELEGLVEALGEFDLNVSNVRSDATRAEPVTTIILICVVSAFFVAIARRAGEDTYDGLKRFIKRLSGPSERRREPERALPQIERIIIRSPTGLTVQIGLDTTDAALRALAEREFTDEDQGTFHYVPAHGWELDPPD